VAEAVTRVLNKAVPAVLSFGASQLGIGNLPREVAKKISEVVAIPRKKIEEVIAAGVDRAKTFFGGDRQRDGKHDRQPKGKHRSTAPACGPDAAAGGQGCSRWTTTPAFASSDAMA
jgi:hypothetical protein